jgi:hypothetical protein
MKYLLQDYVTIADMRTKRNIEIIFDNLSVVEDYTIFYE